MAKSKTTAERGKFKELIHKALYNSEPIRQLILGDTNEMGATDVMKAFKKHVMSHLFIDDTITEASTFIFYDVEMPYLHSNVKDCKVVMYLICHRDILENYSAVGYYGDRIDILSQMVEDALINDETVVNKFGIGALTLDSVSVYNATRFYGCIMEFSVPAFR